MDRVTDRTTEQMADHLLNESEALDHLIEAFRTAIQRSDSTKEQWEALDCLRTASAGLRGAAVALHTHITKHKESK